MTKNQILDVIKEKPYLIGNWVGFKKLTDIHNDWIKSFLFAKDDQTVLGHRGSYKTTCLSVSIALMLVIYPTKKILFFRKTDDDVAEIITQVKNILRSGCIQLIVQTLYGIDLKMTKETQTEINTNLNTDTKGASQLLGLGIKTSITGKHADIVITDDIVNLNDRISPAERNRIKLAYNELQNIKNRGGRFINTGTPWHKDDAISIMPNVKKYDCYSTGLITREQIAQLRKSMSDSLFAANYELKHISDSDTMFKHPQFIADESLIYDGVAHIDAAYDGADGTAFTIFKLQKDGRIIGLGKRWDKHVDDCLIQIKALHQRYRAGTIENEQNADKGYLKKELKAMGLPVHGYHESMNKYIKISTYLRKHWTSIWWLEETDPEYIDEILDYSEFADHDDSPDSAASLIRKMFDKPKLYRNESFKGGI